MKRVITYILVFSILISCCMLSVSADFSDAPTGFGRSYIDLMVSPSYTFKVNNESIGSEAFPNRFIDPSYKATSVSIRWKPNAVSLANGYIFSISSDKKPSSVVIYRYDSASGYNATLVGNQGTNYYYRYGGGSDQKIEYLTITANYSSVFSGYFALNSCYATYPSSKAVDFTDNYQITATDNFGDGIDSFSLKSGGMTAFPISEICDFNSSSGVLNFTGKFDFDYSVLESYSFIFETIGTVSTDDISFGVYTTSGVLKYLLPVELIPGIGYWYDLGDSTTDGTLNVRQNVYCATVDLTGLDLGDFTSKLSINVHPLTDPVGLYYYAAINVTNFSFRQPVYETPWYVNFYNWISGTVNKGYQSIVDAITGSDSDTQEGSELDQEADQIKDDAEKLQQDLTIVKPDIIPPSQDDDIGGMLTGTGVAPMGAVLGVVTGNSLVLKILLLVFTLALCAYVFFGKRG